MQLKISNFFKCPSVTTSTPTPLNDDDDDLSNWENKQHHIFNTYRRTRRNPNPNPVASPSTVTGKTVVVKNKKRSYAQFHLDFGQSDFLLRACSTCGVEFTPGNEEDEKVHKEFHKRYTQGIQFRGWTNERVIPVPGIKGGRIVLVLETDPSSHRNKVEEVVKMVEIELGSGWIVHEHCKVYLFVSLQRIVGCLVAEPIKEAFRVVSCSAADHSDSTRKKEAKLCSTTLQFGSIVFQREVEKRAVDMSDSEVMDGRAIFCESKPVAAVCGIRAIWVTPSNRRKRIASQLLDAVRKSFCMGFELERAQLAFSLPTSAGKVLACSYTGTGSFLVYKAVESVSRNSCGIGESRVIEAENLMMSIQVIRNVTKNFAPENELDRGGFGVIYKGELDDGTKIAVKQMEAGVITSKALDEFQAEIAALSKVRHQHLVSLLGYSINGNERILVYEYVPQGALSKHLFHWKSFALEPLSWKRRLNIALDVARGMEYLHTLAQQSFIHRDLKSSNILLTDDLRAKVSDFGLVKLTTEGEKTVMNQRAAGTSGYLAPEYAMTGKITTKADVFSFGVVLMELLTGLMALDENRPEESQYLAAWFRHIKSDKKKLMAAVDPVLDIKEETFGSISIIAELAGHCTAREPSQRPDMSYAVNVLSPIVEK